MEIHRPKLAHNVREFAVEILTIVLGVVIAISLEQVVEALHWVHEVEEGRTALHREIAADGAFFDFRVKAAPCVDAKLNAASAAIESLAAGGRSPALGISAAAPGHQTLTSEWASQRASQTLTHFPRGERAALSRYYDQLADMNQWKAREDEAWAALSVLDGPTTHLTAADLAQLRINLQEAREYGLLLAINGKREIDRATALGVRSDPIQQYWMDYTCGKAAGAGVRTGSNGT